MPEQPQGTRDNPVILETPLIHVCGGTVYQVHFETSARQVKLDGGGDVQTRLALMEKTIAGSSSARFAATIAERDKITGLNPGDMVDVADATGDPSVAKGGARYLRLPDGWRKIGEDESMDLVSRWEDVEGRPLSEPRQMDQAVALAHGHNNMDTIAHLGVDAAENLTYKGRRIDPGITWCVFVDSLDQVPASLPEGGLVIVPRDASAPCCPCAERPMPDANKPDAGADAEPDACAAAGTDGGTTGGADTNPDAGADSPGA